MMEHNPVSWKKKEEIRRETSTRTWAGTRSNQQIIIEQNPFPGKERREKKGDKHRNPSRNQEEQQIMMEQRPFLARIENPIQLKSCLGKYIYIYIIPQMESCPSLTFLCGIWIQHTATSIALHGCASGASPQGCCCNDTLLYSSKNLGFCGLRDGTHRHSKARISPLRCHLRWRPMISPFHYTIAPYLSFKSISAGKSGKSPWGW